MNWSKLISNSVSTLSNSIYVVYDNPEENERIILGQPNARVSRSSEIVPYASPCLTIIAHWGSASDSAWIIGRPISYIIFIASYFSVSDILTDLWLIFSRSNTYPSSRAYSAFYSASCFIFFLLRSSAIFSYGGFPSKTHTGVILLAKQSYILARIPIKWPVLLPIQSVGITNFPWLIPLIKNMHTLGFNHKLIDPVGSVNCEGSVIISREHAIMYGFGSSWLEKIHQLQDPHFYLYVL